MHFCVTQTKLLKHVVIAYLDIKQFYVCHRTVLTYAPQDAADMLV